MKIFHDGLLMKSSPLWTKFETFFMMDWSWKFLQIEFFMKGSPWLTTHEKFSISIIPLHEKPPTHHCTSRWLEVKSAVIAPTHSKQMTHEKFCHSKLMKSSHDSWKVLHFRAAGKIYHPPPSCRFVGATFIMKMPTSIHLIVLNKDDICVSLIHHQNSSHSFNIFTQSKKLWNSVEMCYFDW